MSNNSPDPFTDDIVVDPRKVFDSNSLDKLNEPVASQVYNGLLHMAKSERPRFDSAVKKALLIVAPVAGTGKSHLIGRVFRDLSSKATLVYVRPYEDPESAWISLLGKIVQELQLADRHQESRGQQATQLEIFAHGVFSQIVADYLDSVGGIKSTIEKLRRPAEQLVILKQSPEWLKYIDSLVDNSQVLGKIDKLQRGSGLRLSSSLSDWIRVLYAACYSDNWETKQACIDWILALPLDEEDTKALGIRQSRVPVADQTSQERNNTARDRVKDLCALAAYFRPFLICFDQTENFGKTPDLARSFGALVSDLVDECPNQQCVITSNLDPWEKRLRPYWEDAFLGRIEKPFLQLRGIDRSLATELINQRFDHFEVPPLNRFSFNDDGIWLDSLFEQQNSMPVRQFLGHCSERWQLCESASAAPVEVIPLDQLYENCQNIILSEKHRLVFDQDVLHWMVTELARGYERITVDKYKSRHFGSSVCWKINEQEIYFGFESGSHWKTWQKITDVSSAIADDQSFHVFFRTAEQCELPKPTWNKTGDSMRGAMECKLKLFALDQTTMARVYGAHDLYSEAIQGDIDHMPKDTLGFLRDCLSDVIAQISAAPEPRIQEPVVTPRVVARQGESQQNNSRVAAQVEKFCFTELGRIVDELPGLGKEAILECCKDNPHVHIHYSPKKTLLQWLP